MWQPVRLAFSISLLLLGIPVPANASDPDKWRIRFGTGWSDPDIGYVEADARGNRVDLATDGAWALQAAIERMISARFGLEFGINVSAPEVVLQASLVDGSTAVARDDLRMTTATLAFNFHLTPNRRVDLYAGPLLAYLDIGDFGYQVQSGTESIETQVSSNDNFTHGAQIGMDIPLGDSGWAINTAARWIDGELSVTDENLETRSLAFDPLLLGVGLRFKF